MSEHSTGSRLVSTEVGVSIALVSHLFLLALGPLAVLSAMGCAHGVRATRLEELRSAADGFHQRIRWKDFRGAAELIAPERRVAFERARRSQNDEFDKFGQYDARM